VTGGYGRFAPKAIKFVGRAVCRDGPETDIDSQYLQI
jgi:hypothetical protein